MKATYKLETRVSKAGNEYTCVVLYVDGDEVEMLMISKPTQKLLQHAEIEHKTKESK